MMRIAGGEDEEEEEEESGREREERLNDLLRWQFATIFIFPSGPTALMWS
jgi:hypothetical protein